MTMGPSTDVTLPPFRMSIPSLVPAAPDTVPVKLMGPVLVVLTTPSITMASEIPDPEVEAFIVIPPDPAETMPSRSIPKLAEAGVVPVREMLPVPVAVIDPKT